MSIVDIIYDKCVDIQDELYRFILKINKDSLYFYYSKKTKTNTLQDLLKSRKSRDEIESIEKSWKWYTEIVFRDYV